MRMHKTIVIAVTFGLATAFSIDASAANDVCRRPCQFYLPQKGEADPAAYGCHDLIDNLSGICGVSLWDRTTDEDIDIAVHTTPHLNFRHHAPRRRIFIPFG